MPVAVIVPLEVFGIGFIIAFGIAVMIKALLIVIRKFTKDEEAHHAE
ncbi:MAG: hypothetical protein ACRCW2_11805 [Cellulosilyticaceae bacterium]